MVTDFTLAYGYQLEPLDELPNAPSMRPYYVPPGGTGGGQDGILLRVGPVAAQSWIGCFAFGHFGVGFSAVISLPTPQLFAVISEGAATS